MKLKEMASQGFDSIPESVATILLWFVGTLQQVQDLSTLFCRGKPTFHETDSLLKFYNERLVNKTAVHISIATLLVLSSSSPLHSNSNQIRRVPKLLQPHRILLDTPRTNEPIKNTNAPRLIIRPASRTTKRLLPYSARALLGVVYVASGVPEGVGCL